MFQRIGWPIVAVLTCTLAFVSTALAQQVTIMDETSVGKGATLEGGTYRIKVVRKGKSSQALFYQGGELWLRVPVTVVEEAKKTRHTEVDYREPFGALVVTKICIEGSRECLLFKPPASAED